MTEDLISKDDAQNIIQQVHIAMREALSNQVELSKAELLQMMTAYFNKALDDYLDTVKKKLDEISRDMDNM